MDRDGQVRIVLEVLEGVGPFVMDEVADAVPGARVEDTGPTEVRVAVDDARRLLELRTVVAAYLVVELDARRPRGLLSPERLERCAGAVQRAREVAKPARFRSFRLSAAGRESPDLVRLASELARVTGLAEDPEGGDMLLRLRRPPAPAGGWELLVRLTPRPLSTRSWRVANYPGALNATIAAAVVAATDPAPADRVVDLMCGSGTLVIERLARGAPDRLVACDISADALDAARANQRAARLRGRVEHVRADVRDLAARLDGRSAGGAGTGSFDRLLVNLPWGELVGSHTGNEDLYPAVLGAARRLASPDARLALLTHDIRRFDRALERDGSWEVTGTHRFFQKGHRPKLHLLRPATA